MKIILTAAAFYLVIGLPAMLILGRIIRRGTEHLDRPLPPHSLRGGRPWGGPI